MAISGRSGEINLICPTCRKRSDPLVFQRVDPGSIGISKQWFCPMCHWPFWPENGFLLNLHLHKGDDSCFGVPLSLGGAERRDSTQVAVGETRYSKMHTLFDEYEIEKITLRGANRAGVSEEDWLEIDPHYNPQTQVSLGDEVLISLTQVNATDVAISANLQEDRPEKPKVDTDDDIDILYDATMELTAATNPPWLLNLQEAEAAIRRKNTVPVLPLLISAFDNLLYRQVYLLLRSRGPNEQEAVNQIQTLAGGGDIYRDDLAKDILDTLVGERLSNGRHAKKWSSFMQLKNKRDQIVHPTGSASVTPPTQDESVKAFNETIEMMLCTFELCWGL